MPTGYTCAILDGISFNDFVMRCARAMGALVSMRDDPLSTPVPEKFEVSMHHSNAIQRIIKEINELKGMCIEELEMKVLEEYEKKGIEQERRIQEIKQQERKYEEMLSRVIKWTPPTKNHIGLKDFMIQQIKESIKWDCGISHLEGKIIQLVPTEKWKVEKLEKLYRDLAYHEKNQEEEIERVENRNKWISELRNSLI